MTETPEVSKIGAERTTEPTLPKGWELTTLGQVTRIEMGQSPPSETYNTSGDGLPFFQGKAEFGPMYPEVRKYCSSPKKVAQKGAILMSVRAPVGPTNLAPGACCIGRGLAAIEPRSGVDTNFLLYLFRAIEPILSTEGTGSTFAAISGGYLRGMKIKLPPSAEQRRIVAKIEELFSELDDSVANLKTARARLQTYRQSLLKHAFEGRLTEQWRRDHADELESADKLLERIREERQARYQQQLEDWKTEAAQVEAGGKATKKPRRPAAPGSMGSAPDASGSFQLELPADWSWVKIESIGKVETGVTPLKKRSDYYEGGEIPWVTSGALNDAFVTVPSGYVTDRALEETNLKVFPSRTLLVAMYGEGRTRGKASELTFESTTNQAIAAIVQKGIEEQVRPYLKWFLLWNYDKIRLASSGGVQPNLNLGIVKSTVLPLPPLREQEMLVELLESRFSYIEETESLIRATMQKVEMLRQSIFKRAFEGRLVSQHPYDEPASELIARIRGQEDECAETAAGWEGTRAEADA